MILLGLTDTCLTYHTRTMYIRSACSPSTVLWAFHTIQLSSYYYYYYCYYATLQHNISICTILLLTE